MIDSIERLLQPTQFRRPSGPLSRQMNRGLNRQVLLRILLHEKSRLTSLRHDQSPSLLIGLARVIAMVSVRAASYYL